ncbi:470_t:CDS:2 [Ambispora leptoticha]|uniref:470_t:CDS:1 n=1 Tax=Ambispora leptoticha TaxID=144679 RepID=A0A9N9H183_9GLOM|nr:470_t:CDS:2 [Ambispora leptoticha]
MQSININNYAFKLAAYADDLTVGISSTTDWDSFTNTINKYKKASNAKINKHKSILIPLTENDRKTQLKEAEILQVHDTDKPLTILGYEADITGSLSKNIWQKMGGLEAPVLKDILDLRLVLVWIKLLSSNHFWAKAERNTIQTGIQNKRSISIKAIRTKEQVVAMNNWPWPLEDLKIEQATADNYSVKICTEALRKELPPAPTLLLNAETPQQELSVWIKMRSIQNKKKDIFWRLLHRALPLGRSIWEQGYKMLKNYTKDPQPNLMKEIFLATNIRNPKKHHAAIWVHIHTIYEIWL